MRLVTVLKPIGIRMAAIKLTRANENRKALINVAIICHGPSVKETIIPYRKFVKGLKKSIYYLIIYIKKF